jgi:hypothetical protein
MSKVWIGVAAAVLAAGVVLYVLLGRGGDEPKKTKAPEVAIKTPATAATDGPRPRPELPKRSAIDNTADPYAKGGYTEHITADGVRIRDKRGRPVPNTDLEKRAKRPFKALDIDAQVVAEMGNKLRGVARKCKQAHPGDLTSGARVQPRVAFEIKAGQLSVTEAEVALEAIADDSEFSRCFYSGTIGLAVAASGHRDVERHRMLVPIDMDKI